MAKVDPDEITYRMYEAFLVSLFETGMLSFYFLPENRMERRHMEQLETIRSYWNTRADGYSKSVMEEMEDAQKEGTYWKTLLDKYLPKADNPKVLDLGCGPGFFTIDAWSEGLSDDRI